MNIKSGANGFNLFNKYQTNNFNQNKVILKLMTNLKFVTKATNDLPNMYAEKIPYAENFLPFSFRNARRMQAQYFLFKTNGK